jgi:hypothetical protein
MTTTEHSIGAAFEYAVRARRDGIAREIILRDLVAMGIESDEVSEFLDTCWYGFLHGWGTEFVLEATGAGADRADIIENMVAMGFQESEAPEFYEQVLQEFQERLGDEIQDAVASGVEAAFDKLRRADAHQSSPPATSTAGWAFAVVIAVIVCILLLAIASSA